MYTIKRAAEQVGVSVSTLRAWERRYGVGAAQRTEAGYRLYDEQAVHALATMSALVDEGWSVRAAAEEVHRRGPGTAHDTAHETASEGDRATDDQPTDGRAPEGSRTRVDRHDDLALVSAAEEFDAQGLTTVLDRRFGTASFEAVVDGWLLPALGDVGRGWETGRVSVAGEHLVAGSVERRLSAAYNAAGERSSGPRVVLGLPPGSRHELGLLSFATAARRAGLATTYLGADVPAVDWGTAVTAMSADCAVLAVPMDSDVEATAETVATLQAIRPGMLLAVGGAAQDLAPEQCLRLGHQVGPAAALLAARLAGPGSS